MSVVTRIRTSQEVTLPFTREEVWAVLADVDAYPDWWPAKLRVAVLHHTGELLGAEFEVRPVLGRLFRIRFEELEGKSSMRLRFFGGSLEGPGGFHLHSLDGGTEVRYEMDVFARGLDVAVLSTVVPLDRIHRSRMRSVLNALAARLKTLHKTSDRDLAAQQAEVEAAGRRAAAAAEEGARLAREEAERKRAENEALALAAAENARRRALEEAAARAAAEEAARLAAESAHRAAEEEAERPRAEEEAAARVAKEEAARLALEEAERKRAEEEAQALAAAEDARKRAEEEAAARAAAEESARRAAEKEAARLALEEAEKKRAEEEALALAAAEDARKRAEEEAAARAAAEESARRAAEKEAARLALEEAEKKRAEEEALALAAAEDARKRAEQEAAVRAAAEESARRAAEEEEAARLAREEAERKRAEEEALALAAAEDARKRAEQEAAARAAAEAAALAAAAEEEARKRVEEEAAARRAEALSRIDTAERKRLAAGEAAARAAAEASKSYVSGDVDHAADHRDTGAIRRSLWNRLGTWLHDAPAPAGKESIDPPAADARESNFDIARRYLVALSANAPPDQIGDFLAPEVTEEEFSHRFRTTAVGRGRDEMLEARARMLSRFSSQRYQLAGATGGGSLVAMEVRWRGTVASTGDGFTDGQEFDARIAMFLKFAEGRIVRQRIYPCFEPWSTKAERTLTLDERVTHAGERAVTSQHQRPSSLEAQGSNFEISRRYLEALGSRADADTIAHFFAQDAVQDEFPNRFLPAGAQRDLLAIRLARTRGLALLASEHCELIGATGGGSQVALEVVWSAVVGEDPGVFVVGQGLEARLGIFLTFRDGLIVSQRIYHCPTTHRLVAR